MSDDRKLQHAYDALIADFLAPLVGGELARVGRPVAPGALEYFAQTRSSSAEAESRIFDQLHRFGSEIAPLSTVPWPSRDLVAMTMIMHDLAFLTDPALDRVFSRGARRVVLDWIDLLLDGIEPPSTRGEAAARYALLEPYLAIKRRDTVVRNWAYTYRYFGRPVPANVKALPRLRMVREEHSEVDLLSLFSELDGRDDLGLQARLRDLVARSPVTELSRPDRFGPLRFGIASLRVLSDPALRGGIARRIAAAGEWACAPVLGHALGAPEIASAPPRLIAPALQLLLEVHITVALESGPEARIPDPLEPGAARYASVLPAWLEDALAIEDMRLLDEDDRAILQRRAERLRRRIPPEILTQTQALVTRARTVLFSVPEHAVDRSIEVIS